MALTQADLDNLEEAIASGVLTAEYDGQRVTFQSGAELRKAANYVRGQLEKASLGAPKNMATFAEYTRG